MYTLPLMCALLMADSAPRSVILLTANTRIVPTLKNGRLRDAKVDNGNIARLTWKPGDRQVDIHGVLAGKTRLILTDSFGNMEAIDVEVRSSQLKLNVGSTIFLQMTTRKPIRTVFTEREDVISVMPTLDPTTISIKGLAPGRTKLTLVDEDGNKDSFGM